MTRAARGAVLVAHPGTELYGSDRVLLESVSALLEGGREVTVAVPEEDGPLVRELVDRGAKVAHVPLPVIRRAILRPSGFAHFAVQTIAGWRAGRRLLRDIRPELVYVNTVTIPLWLVLARIARVPSICHVHESESSARAIVRKGLAAPVLLATTVIANSKFSVSVLSRSFRRLADAEVVPNAVVGPPAPHRARASVADGLRVVYVGRLSPRKGVDVAVSAVEILRGRGIPTTLDLVGSVFTGYEWYERELREQVARGELADAVTFHGFVDPIWDLVQHADVVVVPSRVDEPFGNTAVEAILAARPVIASATSGLLEATDGYRSARLVAPDNAGELADALAALVSTWAAVAEQAMLDARQADERHSVAAYRGRVRAIADRTVVRG